MPLWVLQQEEYTVISYTSEVLQAIQSEKYDLIVLNFANPDMVGHTGNLEASLKALEVIEQCRKRYQANK